MSRADRIARRRAEEATRIQQAQERLLNLGLVRKHNEEIARKIREVEWLIPQFLARMEREGYPGVILVPETGIFQWKGGWEVGYFLVSGTSDRTVSPYPVPVYLMSSGTLRTVSKGRINLRRRDDQACLDSVLEGLRKFVNG